jgi:hypothetical protein
VPCGLEPQVNANSVLSVFVLKHLTNTNNPPDHLHIHNGYVLPAVPLDLFGCGHAMALYYADDTLERAFPFGLLYMIAGGGHNHPLGIRVSASASETRNMGELIRSMPAHQRPTLKRIK